MPEINPQVDPERRLLAAKIVDRFRRGEITNDEFGDTYSPLLQPTKDRVLRAIATVLWGTYSDLREHTLPPQHGDMSALFDRCILFLRSDLPYRWERDNFIGVWGLTWLLRAIVQSAKRLCGRTAEQAGLRTGPDSLADWRVWPFDNAKDLKRVKDDVTC